MRRKCHRAEVVVVARYAILIVVSVAQILDLFKWRQVPVTNLQNQKHQIKVTRAELVAKD
jgi:hypothetical protein